MAKVYCRSCRLFLQFDIFLTQSLRKTDQVLGKEHSSLSLCLEKMLDVANPYFVEKNKKNDCGAKNFTPNNYFSFIDEKKCYSMS